MRREEWWAFDESLAAEKLLIYYNYLDIDIG